MAYTKAKIKDLVDGKIDRDTLQTMLSTPKDRERFEIYLEILQEQVSYRIRLIRPRHRTWATSGRWCWRR